MTTLITGASGGIGAQLALLCAQRDDELLITGRNADKLAAVKANLERDYHGKVTALTLDLAQPDAAARLEQYTVERHITIDTLINDAGFGDWTTFLDMDDDHMRAMMQVNMITLAELCHRFGRRMRTRGHGRILNIASVAAALPGPYMAMYYATKAFVRSLSVALAYELRGTGVTCTVVCPGPVSTGFERAANMHGRNFFTMVKPSTPQAVARFAYAKMQAGSALAYSGAFAKLTALGVRGVPTRLAARCAAYMNGGDPHTSR